MKANAQSDHQILVDEFGILLTQCLCCGEVELYFRGIAMALNLTDLYALVTRLEDMPAASNYLLGLLDLRDVPVQVGFQAVGLQLTENERHQLLNGLHQACLRLDLNLMMRGKLPLN
ncbi:hypothetical protein GO755_16920 [Spirosoma sp. HMF4905]|uniref:Uncharacterized protein n=1 Tax=Spirosoma arboris TaxID=2682092 RepID=A0A7K1SD71_9BACT|nr:hypothetical protein [Spirosoma arboris]MVM31733.1 hypothetical protein [Spirosoma arboris]